MARLFAPAGTLSCSPAAEWTVSRGSSPTRPPDETQPCRGGRRRRRWWRRASLGAREAFDVIVERHRRASIRLLPLRRQPRRRQRSVAGGVCPRVARAARLQGTGGAFDVALPHRRQRLPESRAGQEARHGTARERSRSWTPRPTIQASGLLRGERAVAVRRAIAELPDEAARDADPADLSRPVASANRRHPRQLGRRGQSEFLPRAAQLEEDPRERAMSHLTPDELVDAVEGTLESARQRARRRVRDVRASRWPTRLGAGEARGRSTFPNRRRCSGSVSAPACAWRSPPSRPMPLRACRGLRWPVLAPLAAAGADRCGAWRVAVSRDAAVRARPDVIAEPSGRHGDRSDSRRTPRSKRCGRSASDLVGPFDVERRAKRASSCAPGSAERAALNSRPPSSTSWCVLLKQELGKSGG